MPEIYTQVELPADPATVRKLFFDFDAYPTWSTAFLKSIEVTHGDKANPQPGDKLKVLAGNMNFAPVVQVNDGTTFKWCGSLPFVFTGAHRFEFHESKTTPGGTTFVHAEVFSGLVSFLMLPTWSWGQNTKAGFEGFNADIKRKLESL